MEKGLSEALAPALLAHAKELDAKVPVTAIQSVQKSICEEAQSLFEATRARTFSGELNAESSLGPASKPLYSFVRCDLGVPFHCGIWEHPTVNIEGTTCMPQRPRKTIGSWISIIYEAIRDRKIRQPLSADGSSLNHAIQ